jgi:glucose-6-phosphate dehydrogenase assembly protein OpcA
MSQTASHRNPNRAASNETVVPLNRVEAELARRLHVLYGLGEGPVQRACMSNLIIYCDAKETAAKVADVVPAIVALHPARVLLLTSEPGSTPDLTASISVRGNLVGDARWMISEQVTLHAVGQAIARLPYVVRTLLLSDLPTNVWWAVPSPPAFAGQLLFDLIEHAQQIVYDSIGWLEPAKGVAACTGWLKQVDRRPDRGGRWRVASDLNWRRLKYWRRLVSQALDPASAPGAIDSISEILVEHGPHAVIQSWELVSWLVHRLGWNVRKGKIDPNVEISWLCDAPHGDVRLRIHRLPEGPSEIRRVRVACSLDGKPGALNCVVEGERRLCVLPEGVEACPRTLTRPPQDLAGLVGRQLSDRERDLAFLESMEVAKILAESVLGR